MEQVPRKGAKTDKNSENRQERDNGGPNTAPEKWHGGVVPPWHNGTVPLGMVVPLPRRPLARFSI